MTEPAQLSIVPEIHDGMSLNDILTILELHDSGQVELSPEQQDRVTGLLINKVDGCKHMLDHWEDEAKRHAAYALEHAETKRAIQAKAERLENRIVWAMQRNNFEALPGKEFKVKIGKTERVEILSEPTEEHSINFPELVRTKLTFAWDKASVKEHIEKVGESFPYAKVVKHFSPKFSLNRKDK